MLDSLIFGSRTGANVNADGPMMNPNSVGPAYTSSSYFQLWTKYAIYDAKTKKVLAYGVLHGEIQFVDYERIVGNLLGNILAYTPLSY